MKVAHSLVLADIRRDECAGATTPCSATLTNWLNLLGACLLALGLVITCVFIGINL
jgi:hypothetical protein